METCANVKKEGGIYTQKILEMLKIIKRQKIDENMALADCPELDISITFDFSEKKCKIFQNL